MKKVYLIFLLVLVLGCSGEDGADGLVGPSGPGAVAGKTVYKFIPVGNPDIELIPEVSATKVEAGTQIVQVYVLWLAGEWAELPFTITLLPDYYDLLVTVGSGLIRVETYLNGVLYGGDANLGCDTMVVVTDLN